jgi:hypothetical protein
MELASNQALCHAATKDEGHFMTMLLDGAPSSSHKV